MLDLMLLKAQQEYQETMNGWKQIPHIMKWFAEEEVSCNDARSSLAAPAISTAILVAVLRVNLNARSSRRLTLCSSNSTGTSATRRLLGKVLRLSRRGTRTDRHGHLSAPAAIVASRLVFQSLTLQS